MHTVKYFANGAGSDARAVCPCSHNPPAQRCKIYSFLYSNTVRVSMESCYVGMATRLKERAETEFLSAENVTPAEIRRRLQAVYGENTVNRTTVNSWAIKFRECEPGRANIVDQPRS